MIHLKAQAVRQMERRPRTDRLDYPLAVCIGPIRSGTTWIYELLKNHPQCITTEPKETSFFCINYDRGFDWYKSRYQKPTAATRLCVDISPLYFMHLDELLERASQHADDIRIIVCLRNPYERLRSIHDKMNSMGKQRHILDYITDETLRNEDALGYNLIYQKAAKLIERLGADRVYFFYFDDLKVRPREAASDLLEFLGLDVHLSASVAQVVNPTYEPRSRILQQAARKTAALLRWLRLQQLVDFVKFTVGKRILYGSNPTRPSIDQADLDRLMNHFKPEFNQDIDQLVTLTGRDLSHWKRP